MWKRIWGSPVEIAEEIVDVVVDKSEKPIEPIVEPEETKETVEKDESHESEKEEEEKDEGKEDEEEEVKTVSFSGVTIGENKEKHIITDKKGDLMHITLVRCEIRPRKWVTQVFGLEKHTYIDMKKVSQVLRKKCATGASVCSDTRTGFTIIEVQGDVVPIVKNTLISDFKIEAKLVVIGKDMKKKGRSKKASKREAQKQSITKKKK
eukprot:gnl/Carplike_NY0171/2862_a3844_595.p1 GENE.gnl/Carplike_NY0171/2862_a3844_595~~gnl/Carplike_NY0171/2862_a3844_595.p1  ORF type:complete len:207 (-),score=70.87 gnl/Carplike_NY0171/2862_a3844_595:53-673(-)